MPMEELLAMYGYGSASQPSMLPTSDPAVSNSANCSISSSSSSSSDGDDEVASAAGGGEDGQLSNGGSGIMGISGDTAMHTSRLLRCELYLENLLEFHLH